MLCLRKRSSLHANAPAVASVASVASVVTAFVAN
jgi:hypothetical protein